MTQLSYYNSSITPNFLTVRSRIDDLCKKANITPSVIHDTGGYMLFTLGLTIPEEVNGEAHAHSPSLLSEFPSNCGTLILNRVQSLFNRSTKYFLAIESLACKIAQELEFSGMFISTSDPRFRDFLVEALGYEIVLSNLWNPHSKRNNWYLIKKFYYEKYPNHQRPE